MRVITYVLAAVLAIAILLAGTVGSTTSGTYK